MSRRPRLNSLRVFEAAARHMSFSRAALELNLSQAAVSQQLRQLEDYLGSPLFLRANRSIALTGEGQAYFFAVQEALDRLDLVTDQLFPDGGRQRVTVRCTPSVATLWLAPMLSAFHDVVPEAEIHIRTLDPPTGSVRSLGADVEVFLGSREAMRQPGVRRLWDGAVVPVASPEYLRTHGPFTSAEDLLRCALIHTLGYENDWHRWFRSYAPSRVAVPSGFSADGSLVALDAAQRGEGVALGIRPIVDGLLAKGDLALAWPGVPALPVSAFLRVPPAAANRRGGNLFIDWLLQRATQS